MTKEEVIGELKKGTCLSLLFDFEDDSHKADKFTVGDRVIYLPNMEVRGIEVMDRLMKYEIDDIVMDSLYTGDDIIAICGGNEALARYIYDNLDGQNPEEALESMVFKHDDNAVLAICGKTWAELFPEDTFVEVTMEQTRRVAMTFRATPGQMEQLKNGINPFAQRMDEELDHGDKEYQFAVNTVDGEEIAAWSPMGWS
ncbi:MAG: hypothetical protein LUE86_11395 [Clostridiales bacterium]|nr:hypothetical protein [Clostridiales bacterium]